MANRVVPDRYGVINIGKLKENLVTEVHLPAPGFAGGSYAVLLRRPKEDQPYPVTARHEGSSLVWTVQTADTAIAGMGKLECRWYGDNGEVAKSQTYTVRITDGLPDPTEAPEAWAGFMQQVNRDAGRAESAADRAEALEKGYTEALEKARAAAEDAWQGKVSAETSAKEAKADAQRAETAASTATQAAQAAHTAQGAAGQAAQAAKTAKEAAEQAQTGAQEAQTGAETAKTEAQAAKTAAEEAAKAAQGAASTAQTAANTAQGAAAAAENAQQSVETLASQVQGDADKVAADKAEAQKAAGDALGSQQEAQRQATAAQEAATSAGAAADRAAESKGQAETARTGAEAAQTKAEEAAQGVAADREQIGANKSGLEAAQQELTATKEQLAETKATLTTTQEDLKKAQRAIQFQAELTQGQVWDFEEDTQEAYQRQVPSGAKAGAVMAVGGKTVAWNQLQKPRATTRFGVTETVNADGTVNLSGDFTDSSGYGWFPTGANILFNRIDQHIYLGIAPKNFDRSFGVAGYGTFSTEGSNLFVWKAPKHTENWPNSLCIAATKGDVIEYRNIRFAVIDLTLLYGPGNEPTDTSDPRIAQIEAYAAAHPEHNAGELVSALVDEVRVANAAVRNLPGYGWSAGNVANTIERTENGWQYVQRVGSVDLGTLGWYPQKTSIDAYRYQITLPLMLSNTKNIVTAAYSYVGKSTWIGKTGIGTGDSNIQIYDPAYSDGTAESLAAFKQHVQGVMLYYELATPITTDITALMGESLAPFAVEAGGSITLHHPKADEGFAIDVPAKIQYITKLSEVSANG